MTQAVGFIGLGAMGGAIARAILAKPPGTTTGGGDGVGAVLAFDPSLLAASVVLASYVADAVKAGRLTLCRTAAALVERADIVVLAVKPQMAAVALRAVPAVSWRKKRPLVLSIMGGVSIVTIRQLVTSGPRLVVRAMPNLAVMVNRGASAFAVETSSSENAAAAAPSGGTLPSPAHCAQLVLGGCGIVVEVPESQLDAVTGVSGSGPAYVALFVEALADGGVASGLPRALSYQLAVETVAGSAELLAGTKPVFSHPAVLKEAVMSPGGTTAAAVHALERGAVRAHVMTAVNAATERGQDLKRIVEGQAGTGTANNATGVAASKL